MRCQVLIVRLCGKGGRSFKGLGRYLTHHAEAETSGRVAWTHTLNCANDHVSSAIHEMVGTWRDAELLKQEAGVRRGGRTLERPVKHLSLNWHPGEKPDRTRMIAAAESYLAHMGWQEHQAVLVCHVDKAHPHVHIMLNAVHPETGRKLDDGLEKRRSQQWALAYEREHGRIRCLQRLAPVAAREPASPRPVWLAMKGRRPVLARTRATGRLAAPRPTADRLSMPPGSSTHQIRKDRQRRARLAFVAGGRDAYRELRRDVFRTVREEFRSEWASYYAARRKGEDTGVLRARRDDLVARQGVMLTERWDAAGMALREMRRDTYAALLTAQRDERARSLVPQRCDRQALPIGTRTDFKGRDGAPLNSPDVDRLTLTSKPPAREQAERLAGFGMTGGTGRHKQKRGRLQCASGTKSVS